jgi:hypothetical protein
LKDAVTLTQGQQSGGNSSVLPSNTVSNKIQQQPPHIVVNLPFQSGSPSSDGDVTREAKEVKVAGRGQSNNSAPADVDAVDDEDGDEPPMELIPQKRVIKGILKVRLNVCARTGLFATFLAVMFIPTVF